MLNRLDDILKFYKGISLFQSRVRKVVNGYIDESSSILGNCLKLVALDFFGKDAVSLKAG